MKCPEREYDLFVRQTDKQKFITSLVSLDATIESLLWKYWSKLLVQEQSKER